MPAIRILVTHLDKCWHSDVIMSTMAPQITGRCPDGSLNRLFRGRSRKTSRLRVIGLCEGNTPVTGEFPSQRASNAEKVFIWWRHHANQCAVWFRRISQQIHITSEYRYWQLKCICFAKYRGYLKKNYGLDKCSDQLNLPTRTSENHAKKIDVNSSTEMHLNPLYFHICYLDSMYNETCL